MGKSVWDTFAPVYSMAMKSQKHIYDYIYAHIRPLVAGKEVLELATGPGLIAKHVADASRSMIATDFSPNMIEEAKKGQNPPNLSFEVADAADLQYGDDSFDVVIIANALHVVPEPEKVLSEIDRVLRDGGLLVAPNFIHRSDAKKTNLWGKILKLVGISFKHEWTAQEYSDFLGANGWTVRSSEVLKGRIDLMYAECLRKEG